MIKPTIMLSHPDILLHLYSASHVSFPTQRPLAVYSLAAYGHITCATPL